MNRAKSGLLVMLATLVMGASLVWIYSSGFRGEFLFDDNLAIVENESIRELFPLAGSTERAGPIVPQRNTPVTARPLVNLSFAVNYHFGMLDPFGYRVAQVVLHWIAAIVLWWLGSQVLLHGSLEGRYRAAAGWVSFLGAMLWAIHPLNTETVNYVTQRTELLMGLFYFACLCCCLQYFAVRRSAARVAWLFAIFVTSWCGSLCKETMATIPAVVLIGHWMFAASFERESSAFQRIATFIKRDLNSAWLVYVVLASCWLPIGLIYQAGYVTPGGGFGNSIGAVDWWLTQSEVVFLYLRLAVWPWPLLVHYDFPIHHRFTDAWPFVIGCGVLILSSLWCLWTRRWIGFVMLFCLIILSPTLLIPLPGETVAERRMYLPLAAMTMWLSAAIFDGINRNLGQRPVTVVGNHRAFVGSFVLFSGPLIAYAMVSHARVPAYRTQFSIWHDNMQHHPSDHLSWMNVGSMLAEAGQTAKGLPYMERAVSLNPKYERSRFNLARGYESLGRIEDAIVHYQEAIRLDPSKKASHYNLARLHEGRGEYQKAVELYRDVCESQPDFLESHVNLGILLLSISPESTKAQLREAIKHFQFAVDLDASDDNFVNLMIAYQLAGRFQEAVSAGRKAIQAALLENDRQTAAEVDRAIRGMTIHSTP